MAKPVEYGGQMYFEQMSLAVSLIATSACYSVMGVALCQSYARGGVWMIAFISASRSLGSGLIGHNQKMTVTASAMAEKKAVGHRL